MNQRLLTIVAILMIGFVFANAAVDLKKVDDLLKSIAAYEFGDSREQLTEMTNILREAYDAPEELGQIEKKFDKFLKSDATFASKQYVCQRLSVFGTEASVSVLAKMLSSAKEADMARYALERISGAKVDEALYKAVPKVSGTVQIGIINTIGMRKNPAAVPVLVKLMPPKEMAVGEAIMAALGNIGDESAAKVLEKHALNPNCGARGVAMDALIKCADNFAAAGQAGKAIAVYKKLDGPDVPTPIRVAALRGQISADKANAHVIILNVVRGGDAASQSVAIKLIRDLNNKSNLREIAAELPNISPAHQVQLLSAFGDLGDDSVREYVVISAEAEGPEVRVAALKALAALGDASTVNLLAEKAAATVLAEQEAARASLYRLRGREIDPQIIKSIDGADSKKKVELINALGERNSKDAVDTVFDLSKSEDARVRRASIKVLGDLAEPSDLPKLLDVLVAAKSQGERNEATSSVASAAKKISAEGKKSELIVKKYNQVTEEQQKVDLLRTLGLIGEEEALATIKPALENDNAEIIAAGIRALSDWPNDGPAEELLAIVKTSKKARFKVLSLRGYINLIDVNEDRGDSLTVKMYQQALELADEANEKRMALSGLGDIRTMDALNVVLPYLANEDVKAEAEVATVRISDRVRGNNPDEAKAAIGKVIAQTENEQTKKDAKAALDRIK
jgi:HEAT repeat protein